MDILARATEVEERLAQATDGYNESELVGENVLFYQGHVAGMHRQRMDELERVMAEARKDDWLYPTIDSILYSGADASSTANTGQ